MSISLVSKLRALAGAHLKNGPTFVGETCREAVERIEALEFALRAYADTDQIGILEAHCTPRKKQAVALLRQGE